MIDLQLTCEPIGNGVLPSVFLVGHRVGFPCCVYLSDSFQPTCRSCFSFLSAQPSVASLQLAVRATRLAHVLCGRQAKDSRIFAAIQNLPTLPASQPRDTKSEHERVANDRGVCPTTTQTATRRHGNTATQ